MLALFFFCFFPFFSSWKCRPETGFSPKLFSSWRLEISQSYSDSLSPSNGNQNRLTLSVCGSPTAAGGNDVDIRRRSWEFSKDLGPYHGFITLLCIVWHSCNQTDVQQLSRKKMKMIPIFSPSLTMLICMDIVCKRLNITLTQIILDFSLWVLLAAQTHNEQTVIANLRSVAISLLYKSTIKTTGCD